MTILLRVLRFSPARQVALAFARSPAGRRAARRLARKVGRRKMLRLAWRAMRL